MQHEAAAMKRTGPSGGESIDLCDGVVVEILVRLPSKSVLRFRAVCKSWLRITTDPSFLAAHAAHRPREMIVFPESARAVSAIPLSLDAPDHPRFLCNPTLRHHKELLYSLDGLIVLQQRPGFYVVCNPATRQWTNLPVLVCSTAFPCAFYRDGPSGEYRLLCHGVTEEEGNGWKWKDHYYVLTAGAAGPRRLPQLAPLDRLGYQQPVSHRGVLLWPSVHPMATRTGKMMAFHTASETIWLMSPPPPPGVAMTWDLLELDGQLCAATMPLCPTWLDIWVLRDYAAQTWTLWIRIHMPPPPRDLAGNALVGTVIPAGDGAILVGHPDCTVLRSYHLQDNTISKEIHCRWIPSFLVFSESLVSHSFFHTSPRHPDLTSIKFTAD